MRRWHGAKRGRWVLRTSMGEDDERDGGHEYDDDAHVDDAHRQKNEDDGERLAMAMMMMLLMIMMMMMMLMMMMEMMRLSRATAAAATLSITLAHVATTATLSITLAHVSEFDVLCGGSRMSCGVVLGVGSTTHPPHHPPPLPTPSAATLYSLHPRPSPTPTTIERQH